MATSTTQKLTEHRAKTAKPDDGATQLLIWDTATQGFGVRVGKTKRTYIVQGRVRGTGERVRINIGPTDALELKDARTKAKAHIGQMAAGINPNTVTRQQEAGKVTLKKAWNDYLEELGFDKPINPNTLRSYKAWMRYLADWMDMPLANITTAMVRERRNKIRKDVAKSTKSHGPDKGKYAANACMRIFRAVYNFALEDYEELPRNPVRSRRKGRNKMFYQEQRRDAAIPRDQLPAWLEDVNKSQNPVRRDALLFLLFSGLRRSNVQEARWEHVDWEAKTLFIPMTKARRPFTLPLSNFLVELLEKRREANPDSEWVFPANSNSGHLTNPLPIAEKKQIRVSFIVHGLRHTFINEARHVVPNHNTLKELVDHTVPKDVTGGYMESNPADLAQPMQAVTDRLLQLCNPAPESDKVVPIKKKA